MFTLSLLERDIAGAEAALSNLGTKTRMPGLSRDSRGTRKKRVLPTQRHARNRRK